MNSNWLKAATFLAFSFVLLTFGCAQKSEPVEEEKPLTYAEALQTYTSEAEELDRLKQKRAESTNQDLLSTVLGTLQGNSQDLANELKDLVPEYDADAAQEQLESLGALTGSATEKISDEDLQKLDEQIAKQEARVARAREAKDKAEATQ